MKNKNDSSKEMEIIEIPEYELLTKRARCSKCKNRYNCYMNTTRSETGAKIYCNIFAKRFYTIEFIIFLIVEIIGILKIFSLDKGWLISSAIAVVYTIAVLVLETFISKVASLISENKEIKRKANYEKEVEKIKENNEQIKRNQTGETEEYLEFLKKMNSITDEICFCWANLKQKQMKEEAKFYLENNEVVEKFKDFTLKLEKMNKKINAKNYHPNANLLQTFYGSYTEALLEKMQIYIDLYIEEKLTQAQIVEYQKLLDNFISKINSCVEKLDETESEKILLDIKQLNKLISSKEAE